MTRTRRHIHGLAAGVLLGLFALVLALYFVLASAAGTTARYYISGDDPNRYYISGGNTARYYISGDDDNVVARYYISGEQPERYYIS